ncbi:hypothetical protein AMECASPLE_030038 [Ameca splendens]|uniref:Uncharacterized protein n=1 Tax=Ameca splendens TaxID=208324 RepID=A0ABV0ZRG4_9TELE
MQQQKVSVLTCLCNRTSKRYYRREKSDQTRELHTPNNTPSATVKTGSDKYALPRLSSRGASTHIPAIRYQDEILRPIVTCFAGAQLMCHPFVPNTLPITYQYGYPALLFFN